MTTTNSRDRAIKLAHAARSYESQGNTAAATTYREKAEKICEINGFPVSILDTPQETTSAARTPNMPPPERRYSCRYGCTFYVTHTADELAECAAKKREREGTDSAYDIPKNHDTRSSWEKFRDEMFGGTSYRSTSGHREHASWTRPEGQRTGSETPADEPKPRRRQTSHAFCDHEPTKAARAHCRKMGGPRF